MSVDYAKVREQFGQPIGSFQAIRHKCAQMLLKVENAHGATYYAAWALDAGAEDAAVAASVAKAYVSEASRDVSARPSRSTAVSASRGSTTCTSISSGPRRWSPCSATPTTTGSSSSAASLDEAPGFPRSPPAARAGLASPLNDVPSAPRRHPRRRPHQLHAGSYAAMMLADLGADVVKVESLAGDSFRELPEFSAGIAARSIAVDLKAAEGRVIVERLAARGDVVMENMRPGVADRLGVGWSRFGDQSPARLLLRHRLRALPVPTRDRPGFDPLLQAHERRPGCSRASGARPSTSASPSPTTMRRRWPPRRCSPRCSCASGPGRGRGWETSLMHAALMALQSGNFVDYPGKQHNVSATTRPTGSTRPATVVVLPGLAATRPSG